MKHFFSEKGLTLIEVLIALVIVSIALGALFQSTRSTTASYQHLRARAAARMVAVNVLTMRQLKVMLTEAGRLQKGREEMFDQMWYWRILESTTHQPLIHRIHVDVFSSDSEEGSLVYELDGFVHAGK